MAEIILTIDDTKIDQIINDMASAGRYRTIIDDLPNSQSKADFVKQMIIDHIMITCSRQEAQAAAMIISQEVKDTFYNEISII